MTLSVQTRIVKPGTMNSFHVGISTFLTLFLFWRGPLSALRLELDNLLDRVRLGWEVTRLHSGYWTRIYFIGIGSLPSHPEDRFTQVFIAVYRRLF